MHGEVDAEIPPEHYKAVAEVIGYVMRLRAAARDDARLAPCRGWRSALLQQTSAPGALDDSRFVASTVESHATEQARTGDSRLMATQDVSESSRVTVDRSQRGGSIGMVLLVAVVLVGAAVALLFIGRGRAEPYILALLAILAVIGVFALFAVAAGILRMPGKDEVDPLIKAITDTANDGLVVTDQAGRVVYANADLPQPGQRGRCQRRAPGRTGVRRRSGRLGGGLPALQGGARGAPAAGGGPHAGPARRAGALAAPAGAAARRGAARRARRCGRSPT